MEQKTQYLAEVKSEGQLLVPENIKNDFHAGDKFLFIKLDDFFVVKSVKDLAADFLEDLNFASRSNKAMRRYEKGDFREMDKNEFLSELEKW